jgi:hypothetical protein
MMLYLRVSLERHIPVARPRKPRIQPSAHAFHIPGTLPGRPFGERASARVVRPPKPSIRPATRVTSEPNVASRRTSPLIAPFQIQPFLHIASPNSSRINTSEKSHFNPSRINTSGNACIAFILNDFNSPRINTSEKMRCNSSRINTSKKQGRGEGIALFSMCRHSVTISQTLRISLICGARAVSGRLNAWHLTAEPICAADLTQYPKAYGGNEATCLS